MSGDWVREIGAEVFSIWWAERHFLVAATVGSLALALLFQRRASGVARWSCFVSGFLVMGAFAWGVVAALRMVWLADDAFISFRYAHNLVAGQGLVFNPGEYVEGYTNFLFVLMLAAANSLGASIPHAALLLDLVSYATLVVVAWLLADTAHPGSRLRMPWAALTVAVGRPFQLFATSGLETETALALAALGVLLWRRQRPVIAGLCLGLSTLTRPDYLLVAGVVWTIGLIVAPRGQRRSTFARFVFPGIVLFLTWWAWRSWYYGAPFPNTFYAKSGGGANYDQGLVYAVHAFLASGLVFAVPLLLVAPFVVGPNERARPLVLVAVLVGLIHGGYITRVGGDFMEYRFLLPTLYFVTLAWAALLGELDERAGRRLRVPATIAASVCLAFVALRAKPIKPMEKRWYLAAEESFWPVERVLPLQITHEGARVAFVLRDAFAGTGVSPRVALGSIGIAGFYSGLPITDALGLTSAAIARKPILERGRPGHERLATPLEMYQDGAVFSNAPVWPGTQQDLALTIQGYPFWLIRHDPSLEALARSKGWRYPDFDQLLHSIASQASGAADLDRGRVLYERILKDTPGAESRLAVLSAESLSAQLRAAQPTDASSLARQLRQAEAFGVEDKRRALEARLLFRFDFESDVQPSAVSPFFWPPTTGTLPNQMPVTGFQGQRLLNTYVGGDASTGSFTLLLPTVVQAAFLEFLVGGGADCALKYVALFDGQREISRWCGENSEHLRQVSVPLQGMTAPRLVLVDEDRGSWGHLLLDDVMIVAQ